MPNCIESDSYECEYGKRSGMCLQRDAVKKGDRYELQCKYIRLYVEEYIQYIF